MHMMFVDESGDPGFPQTGSWDSWGGSKFYCRLGVIIHGWRWKAWNDRLLQFKRNRGLTWDLEIKATDVRSGRHAFVGWDYNRRQLFIRDLAQLVGSNQDITLLGVAIDKRQVTVGGADRVVKPQVRSLELLLERYNLFLRNQRDKAGIVVLDPVKESDDDNIRYFQSYLQAFSNHFKPLHIVESTFFAKSHTSNLIQVADFCTNIFYREMANASNTIEWKALYPRFCRQNGRVAGCGIKKWP
ncbi:MAG: DUF3800 domain-containing protein [bacterium]